MKHYALLLFVMWFFGDPAEPEPSTEQIITENFRNLEDGRYRERLVRNRLSGFEFGRRWIVPMVECLRGVKDAIKKQ